MWDLAIFVIRAVARSEIPGGLVVLGGDNVSPLVEIGLADLPNIGGAKAPPAPTLRQPCCSFYVDMFDNFTHLFLQPARFVAIFLLVFHKKK